MTTRNELYEAMTQLQGTSSGELLVEVRSYLFRDTKDSGRLVEFGIDLYCTLPVSVSAVSLEIGTRQIPAVKNPFPAKVTQGTGGAAMFQVVPRIAKGKKSMRIVVDGEDNTWKSQEFTIDFSRQGLVDSTIHLDERKQ